MFGKNAQHLFWTLVTLSLIVTSLWPSATPVYGDDPPPSSAPWDNQPAGDAALESKTPASWGWSSASGRSAAKSKGAMDTGDPISAGDGAYHFDLPLLSLGGPLNLGFTLRYRSDFNQLVFWSSGPQETNSLPRRFWWSPLEVLEYHPTDPALGAYVTVQIGNGDTLSFKKQGGQWAPTENGDYGYSDNVYPERWLLQETSDYFYLLDPIAGQVHIFAKVSARESFLRASTYYRAAEYLCVPDHPRFDELWRKSQACFHKACPLFAPPIQIVRILFADKYLPGYFWRPADDEVKRPTLISLGGNDDSGEEGFFWNGPAAVRRGYNYFTFEMPGHRGTVHLFPDLIKRPDYEVPFRAALDYLLALPGVDERLALAGHSHGGYTVCRIAIHEPRIQAIIPSTPLLNGEKASFAILGPLLNKIPGAVIDRMMAWKMRKSPAVKGLLYYSLWTLGFQTVSEALTAVRQGKSRFDIEGQEQRIRCAALALAGEGEGQELLRQTRQFYEHISSPRKALHIFTLDEDASDDHCQLDNRSRANQVIFNWLDDTFAYQVST